MAPLTGLSIRTPRRPDPPHVHGTSEAGQGCSSPVQVVLGAYAPLGSSAPSRPPTAASLLHCSAVRPRRCGQHVDATFSTPPWSTEAAETTSSAPSGRMRMASCAVARQRDVILIRAGWDGR